MDKKIRVFALLFAAGMVCVAIDCEWLAYMIFGGYLLYRGIQAMEKKEVK